MTAEAPEVVHAVAVADVGAPAAPVTAGDVHELIGSSDRPLVLYFGAEWCPPCHAIAPVLVEIGAAYADAISIVRLDVDAVPELVVRFAIASAPTLVVVVEGGERLRIVGARSKAALLELLAPFLGGRLRWSGSPGT